MGPLADTVTRAALLDMLSGLVDADGYVVDSVGWRVLNAELQAAAVVQGEQRAKQAALPDRFANYAEAYDALIGEPNLDAFMTAYLERQAPSHGAYRSQDILSVGCGTALVEAHLVAVHGADPSRLVGIDRSQAMVHVARRRIRADVLDLFDLPTLGRTWDLAYSGLNVLQYTPPRQFEAAVRAIAHVVRPGGRFLGDFITPDHIRRYPNLVHSSDRTVLSLRSPRLIERDGMLLQESTITNVSYVRGPMEVDHVGRHARVLPPLLRVRGVFERAFGGAVALFDAVSGVPIPDHADTCPSTRYVVSAVRAP